MNSSRLRPFLVPLILTCALFLPRPSLGGENTPLEKATAAFRAGQLDDAILLYKEVLAADSSDAVAWNGLAVAYSDKANFRVEDENTREELLGKAIEAEQRAIRFDSTEVHYLDNLGNMYTDAGLIDSAIVVIRRATEMDPEEAGHYLDLGVALDRQERYPEAIEQVKHAIELRPYMTKARYNLAYYYSQQGQWIDALRQTIFLDDVDSWFPGLDHAKFGLARRVLPELRGRLADSPDSLDLRVCLAYALAYGKQWPLAKEEADRLLKIDKDNTEALKIAGLIYSWQEDHKSAAKMFKRCVEIDGSLWACYNWLGFSYLNMHKPKQARQIMEKAVALNPDAVAVQMNLGTAYAQTGDYKKAVKPLRASIQLGCKLGKVHYNLAACLVNLKEWDEALIEAKIAEQKGYGPAAALVGRIVMSR